MILRHFPLRKLRHVIERSSSEAAGGGIVGTLTRRRAAQVVCGWCQHFGRPHGMVRSTRSQRWRVIEHDAARIGTLAGRTSHGLCPECRPLLLEEWDQEFAASS